MREIEARAGAGDPDALLALDVYLQRLAAGVASMAAATGGLDVLAFTGGVGEHSALIRQRAADRLRFLGVVIDLARNEFTGGEIGVGVSVGPPDRRRSSPAATEGTTTTENEPGRELAVLSIDECFALLRTHEIGRLGVIAEHYPLIFGQLRTGRLRDRAAFGRRHQARRGQPRQRDLRSRRHRPAQQNRLERRDTRTCRRGRPRNRADLDARTKASKVEPWAPGEHGHWMRLIPHVITGRRIVAGVLPPAFEPGAYL